MPLLKLGKDHEVLPAVSCLQASYCDIQSNYIFTFGEEAL